MLAYKKMSDTEAVDIEVESFRPTTGKKYMAQKGAPKYLDSLLLGLHTRVGADSSLLRFYNNRFCERFLLPEIESYLLPPDIEKLLEVVPALKNENLNTCRNPKGNLSAFRLYAKTLLPRKLGYIYAVAHFTVRRQTRDPWITIEEISLVYNWKSGNFFCVKNLFRDDCDEEIGINISPVGYGIYRFLSECKKHGKIPGL